MRTRNTLECRYRPVEDPSRTASSARCGAATSKAHALTARRFAFPRPPPPGRRYMFLRMEVPFYSTSKRGDFYQCFSTTAKSEPPRTLGGLTTIESLELS